MGIRWKSLLLALAVIVTGGALRLPLEQRYTAEMRQQQLLETPLNLSLRDELGQTFFIAVLGGFRSVVASIVELQTITPWQYSNWGVVDELYAICTKLQPREEHYWEQRSWHLAANARDTYLFDSTLPEPTRVYLGQQQVEKGIAVLREGLQRLPDSWKLWERLAWYSSNYNDAPDYAGAAEYYHKAWELSGRGVYRRLGVFQLCKVPGREKEAWDALMEFYNSQSRLDRSATVEVELLYLYFGRKLAKQYPDVKLPEELARLVNPASVLTPEEQKRRDFLKARANERANPKGTRQHRPPQVTSPNVPKLR